MAIVHNISKRFDTNEARPIRFLLVLVRETNIRS